MDFLPLSIPVKTLEQQRKTAEKNRNTMGLKSLVRKNQGNSKHQGVEDQGTSQKSIAEQMAGQLRPCPSFFLNSVFFPCEEFLFF